LQDIHTTLFKKNMRTVFFFSFFFIVNTLYCQKHDNNWLMGGDCATSSEFFVGKLDFCENENSTSLLPPIPFVFRITNASISDSSGMLLFYTNGDDVFNGKHVLMKNGGDLAGEEECNAQLLWQGAVVVPRPSFEDEYALLTVNAEANFDDKNKAIVYQEVYYNVVDMQSDNGDGELIVKRNLIVADTLNSGQGMVCQHANGRDWWLLLFEFDSNNYYRFLIEPSGVIELEKAKVDLPVIAGRGQSVYSTDGEFMAYFNSTGVNTGTYVDIFNFDRCLGMLSNQVQILFNDEIPSGAGGLAFSPNSRFLYVSNRIYLYQYDLWSEEIEASRITIAEYDGYLDNDIFPTTFHMAQLTPNGKIYITTSADTRFWHVINNPNEKGNDCNFVQRAINLSTPNHRAIPNFPHYRMGALEGSLCDTLGIGSSPFADFAFENEGTPRTYQFEDSSTSDVEEWLWDFGDGNTSSEQNPLHEYDQFGSYEICLTVSNQAGSNTTCQNICVLPDPDTQDYISASSMVLDCALENQEIDLSTTFLDLDFAQLDDWLISWAGPNDFSQSDIDQVSIDKPGVYYLSIQNTTSSCMISDSIIIEEDNLALEFSLSQDSAFLFCNEFVELDLIIDADCFEIRWKRPDGEIFNAYSTTNFNLTTTGLYTFFVRDCNNDCESERTFVIERIPLSALWTTEMNGTEVTFIPETTGVNFFHIWRFGDGNFSAFESPMHTYEFAGTYEVTHEILDGCESYFSTKEIVVTEDVVDAPSATFTYNNQNTDFNFSFEDRSLGEVESWLWDFGDGNISIVQNPNHEYTQFGSYEVCLTATNAAGSDTYCETVCVLPDPVTSELINASDTVLNCTNIEEGILFSSSISLSDFYNSADWILEWMYPDGEVSNAEQVLITGGEVPILHLRNPSSNCSLSAELEIQQNFEEPIFELSTDLDIIPCGSPFALFIDADSTCFEANIYQEETLILASMFDTLTLDGAGSYTVELIDCASGCSSTQVFSIQNERITAAWSSEEMGAVFSFVSEQNTGVDHQWDFGDSATSDEQNPTHTYATGGTYQITHIVSNTCGADTLLLSIEVIISSSTNIADGSIHIFPNPTRDYLTIQSTKSDISNFKLYTSLGQVQVEKLVRTSEVQISVLDYAAGVYWLQVVLTDGRSWTERVVVLEGE